MEPLIRLAQSLVVIILFMGCANSPDLDSRSRGEFSGRKSFPFRNFTLVVADAGTGKATYEFRDFNSKRGSSFRIPFQELDLWFDGRLIRVTNRGVGNNRLNVDGVGYSFDSRSEHVFVSPSGVRIEEGEIHDSIRIMLDNTRGKLESLP